MKRKIICLILFVILLLFLIPTNTFAQTSFENQDLSGPMFNPGPLIIPITLMFGLPLGIVGNVFGLTSWGVNIYKYPSFDITISIPFGFIFDYTGKEPAKFYAFTPIMAGKYGKFYPRLELVQDFSFYEWMDFDYSAFFRIILPLSNAEAATISPFTSVQPFIGTGILINFYSVNFLIDTGIFFQFSIVTLGFNYKIYIGDIIGHKILFKFAIYF